MKANLHGVSRVSDSTLGVRSAVEVVVVVLARWCLGELGDVQRLEGPSVSILELSRGTRGPTYMVLVGCQLASKLVGYTVGKAEDGVLWAQGICSRLSISRARFKLTRTMQRLASRGGPRVVGQVQGEASTRSKVPGPVGTIEQMFIPTAS